MDLNAVRMFVTVVQSGSLTGAAARLGVPLPSLSRRMLELERELGVQLLERSARGSKVTEAGARLFENASGSIESLLEAEQSLRNAQMRLQGRLRLSMPQSFEPWWDLLTAFQRDYPDIEVSVHSTERRVDLVADGIDVALRVGAIVHETMVARHLLSFRHVLVASPTLLERHGLPEQPQDLNHYPCAAWGSTIDTQVRWNLGGQVVEIRPIFTVNDYVQLRERALSGDVVTELPPFLAVEAFRSGKLIPILTERPFPDSPVHLIYRQHRHPSPIVRAYLAFCQDHRSMIQNRCGIAPSATMLHGRD